MQNLERLEQLQRELIDLRGQLGLPVMPRTNVENAVGCGSCHRGFVLRTDTSQLPPGICFCPFCGNPMSEKLIYDPSATVLSSTTSAPTTTVPTVPAAPVHRQDRDVTKMSDMILKNAIIGCQIKVDLAVSEDDFERGRYYQALMIELASEVQRRRRMS